MTDELPLNADNILEAHAEGVHDERERIRHALTPVLATLHACRRDDLVIEVQRVLWRSVDMTDEPRR